jgi:uncharacterized phage protein (TIGR01671 family)
MRENVYRGKNEHTGWVYGDLRNYEKTGAKAIFSHDLLHRVEVAPETVGQYTGLTDKNGAKIFEGDICRVSRGGDTKQGVTECYNGAFGLRYKSGEFNSFLYLKRSRQEGRWFDTLEVIGNIHDNPELLEVTE